MPLIPPLFDKWTRQPRESLARLRPFLICILSFYCVYSKCIASDDLTQHGVRSFSTSDEQSLTESEEREGGVSAEQEPTAAARKIAERFPNTTSTNKTLAWDMLLLAGPRLCCPLVIPVRLGFYGPGLVLVSTDHTPRCRDTRGTWGSTSDGCVAAVVGGEGAEVQSSGGGGCDMSSIINGPPINAGSQYML